MKITVTDNNGSLDSIVTSHLGQELFWSASSYDRSKFKNPKHLFDEINAYWESLPKSRQDAIWAIYVEAYEIIETVNNSDRLTQRLRELVKDLYIQIQYDEIDSWVKRAERDKRIVFPRTLKDDYAPNDIKPLTYLKSDYHGLVTLTVALRPLVPIWSGFIRIVKSHTGTIYKESQALSLLALTDFVHCEPIERLRLYVESVPDIEKKKSMAPILAGMGSVETADWLLALAIVRKVAVGELNTGDENTLITNVYMFVDSSFVSMDRKFGGKVGEKYQHFNDNDEDNASKLENYKIRTEVSDGALEFYEAYVEDVMRMVLRVQPDIDKQKVKKCLSHLNSSKSFRAQPHQKAITAWVMAEAISARSVEELYHDNLLRTISATQAILWHRGFLEIAALMTSKPVELDRDTFFNTDVRSRLTKDHNDAFMERYPFYRKRGRKTGRTRQDNEAISAVDLVVGMIDNSQWEISCPLDILREVTKLPMGSIYPVPLDIRNQIAAVVLSL